MKRALGRGLDALLDDMSAEAPIESAEAPAKTPEGAGPELLPIDMIVPAANQPRKYFDESELTDLANSIKAKGVLQPILVRKSPHSSGQYEIVAGERRWRAAQRAKIHEIPVLIRELDEQEALEIAIIENVQRSDLNAIEEAFGYHQLVEKYQYTQEVLAANLGKSRSHIANTMRLVNLPREVQDAVRTGKLTAGHARVVLGVEDPIGLARKIMAKGMSVREAELAAKKENGAGSRTKGGNGAAAKDSDTLLMEGELSAVLRMPVSISAKNRDSGDVRISYRSLEELDALFQKLRGDDVQVMAHG